MVVQRAKLRCSMHPEAPLVAAVDVRGHLRTSECLCISNLPTEGSRLKLRPLMQGTVGRSDITSTRTRKGQDLIEERGLASKTHLMVSHVNRSSLEQVVIIGNKTSHFIRRPTNEPADVVK